MWRWLHHTAHSLTDFHMRTSLANSKHRSLSFLDTDVCASWPPGRQAGPPRSGDGAPPSWAPVRPALLWVSEWPTRMGTACWPALARGTSKRRQASKIGGRPNRPLFLKARHRQRGPEWASSGQTGFRFVGRGRISMRQNTTRLRKWTAPFHLRETG